MKKILATTSALLTIASVTTGCGADRTKDYDDSRDYYEEHERDHAADRVEEDAEDAGDRIHDAVDGVEHAGEDIVSGAGDAVEDIIDGITGQEHTDPTSAKR